MVYLQSSRIHIIDLAVGTVCFLAGEEPSQLDLMEQKRFSTGNAVCHENRMSSLR